MKNALTKDQFVNIINKIANKIQVHIGAPIKCSVNLQGGLWSLVLYKDEQCLLDLVYLFSEQFRRGTPKLHIGASNEEKMVFYTLHTKSLIFMYQDIQNGQLFPECEYELSQLSSEDYFATTIDIHNKINYMVSDIEKFKILQKHLRGKKVQWDIRCNTHVDDDNLMETIINICINEITENYL